MGSIDFNKPERTDPALDIIENIRNSFRELGKLLGDTTIINPLDGLVRLNPATRRLEKYVAESGTWEEFLDKADNTKAFDMRTALANHADSATNATNAVTAGACTGDCDGTASNAENLGSKPPADYRLKSEIIEVTEGGTGKATAAEARESLDLLQRSANGSDIPSPSTFRTNIGLTAGETARVNLGLGTGAMTNVGTAASYNVGTGGSNLTTNDRVWVIANAASSTGTYTMTTTYIYGSHGQVRVYAPSGYRFLSFNWCLPNDARSWTRGVWLNGIASNGSYVDIWAYSSSRQNLQFVWIK